jgi:type III secretion system FlhB-like substrate exporter
MNFSENSKIIYNFRKNEYKTVDNITNKIKDLFMVIVSKEGLVVGLKFNTKMEVPEVTIKERNAAQIIKLCRENNIPILYNKQSAEYIFYTVGKGDNIPGEMFGLIARVMARIIKKNEEKIKKLWLLCVSKNNLIVGFNSNENMISIAIKKKNNINGAIELCKKFKIKIIYNAKVAEYYYNNFSLNANIWLSRNAVKEEANEIVKP